MSLALLPFAIGTNVRVLIQPLTKANDSFILTPSTAQGAPFNFAGRVETVSDSFAVETTQLTPMDVGLGNNVITGYSGQYEITEFESPANAAVLFAGMPVNILKTCLSLSYYAAIVTQVGVVINGLWTPKTQDKAVILFTNTGRNAARESVKRNATFVLVPYLDATTGLFGFNPILNDTNFQNPFGFLTGNP